MPVQVLGALLVRQVRVESLQHVVGPHHRHFAGLLVLRNEEEQAHGSLAAPRDLLEEHIGVSAPADSNGLHGPESSNVEEQSGVTGARQGGV